MFPWKKNQSSSQAVSRQPGGDIDMPEFNSDVEEDGFVLVGETSDEKTTIKPDDPRNHEPSPSYQSLTGQAGNTTAACDRSHDQATTSRMAQPVAPDPPKPPHGGAAASTSADELQDVPFQFHAAVECALNHGKLMRDISDVMPNIWKDLSEFEYDFNTERGVLDYL